MLYNVKLDAEECPTKNQNEREIYLFREWGKL